MQVKIIIVEPKYQMNVGYIARVAKNFGVKKLFFVRPRAIINGRSAIKFAKHSKELLLGAKIYKNLDEATKDCDLKIGTTGVWKKSNRAFGRIFLLDEALNKIKRFSKQKRVGVIVGRDDIGLKSDEIEDCDIIAYIGSDEKYPVLNISHALAIMLYELTKKDFAFRYKELSNRKVEKRELDFLFKTFERSIKDKKIRDKVAVKEIFKRIVHLAQPNSQEVHALITALK